MSALVGYPGVFPGGFTTGYLVIGAVQPNNASTLAAYPGVFPATFTTGYLNAGAVQRVVAAAVNKGSLLPMFR